MTSGKYDVVVIGSGVGGISTAALATCEGYKTLLLESKERLGGRFSTVDHEGFRLLTGAGAIPPVLPGLWQRLDAQFDVADVPRQYTFVEGKLHELPERGQIAGLLTILSQVEGERAKIAGRLAKEVAKEKILGAFRSQEKTYDEGMTFRDWLRQYTDNERVLQAFHALTSALSTVNDFEMPARYWFRFMPKAGSHGYRKFQVARTGNVDLMNSLAEAMKRLGADIWLNSPTKHIVIRGGKATGVVVEKDGKDIEVEAKAVVSNAGPRRTTEMAGSENFSAKHMRELEEHLRPVPICITFVASDQPLFDAMGAVLFIGLRRVVTGIPLSNFASGLTPAGQHVAVIWATPATCLNHIDIPSEIEQTNLDLKDIFPGLGRNVRILHQEARDIDHEFPACRTWPGFDLPQETPIGNLFDVGDGAKPEGSFGTGACYESAAAVMEKLRKVLSRR